MTSKFKFQGSLKALMVATAAVVLSMSSMQASAQTAGRGGAATGGGRSAPPVAVRPVRPVVPPRPVIVVPPCKRGGPGITPC